MNIIEKIRHHHDNKIYCKVKRQVAKGIFEKSNGYIVDYSDKFILLQETGDFEICGYLVFSIETISNLTLNASDKYYHKIMVSEGLTDQINYKHEIDLTSWESIFRSIKKLNFNAIIENEDPSDSSFDIGIIEKISKTSVDILSFDSKGYLDNEPTTIVWKLITIAKVDDRYINTFSKYLRKRKEK
jgi:hypothetical protein